MKKSFELLLLFLIIINICLIVVNLIPRNNKMLKISNMYLDLNIPENYFVYNSDSDSIKLHSNVSSSSISIVNIRRTITNDVYYTKDYISSSIVFQMISHLGHYDIEEVKQSDNVYYYKCLFNNFISLVSIDFKDSYILVVAYVSEIDNYDEDVLYDVINSISYKL